MSQSLAVVEAKFDLAVVMEVPLDSSWECFRCGIVDLVLRHRANPDR
jgi:hypothetical protein